LKWSLSQGDGTTPTDAHAMSQDDKLFLEKVMKELVKDEPARMNEIMTEFVKVLEEGSAPEHEEKLEGMLDELLCIVDQIDMAQVFVKFGGLECLLKFLELDTLSPEFRCNTASVVGTIGQNNLTVQDEMLKKGVIGRIARVYMTNDHFGLCAKQLYAISCIVRNHALAEEYFYSNLSTEVFQKALASGHVPLLRRAFYFGSALIDSQNASTDRKVALSNVFIPVCFEFLSADDVDMREATLAILFSLQKVEISATNNALSAQFDYLVPLFDNRLRELSAVPADSELAEQAHHEKGQVQLLRDLLVMPNIVRSSSHNAATVGSPPLMLL